MKEESRFTIVVEGMELPSEAVERINAALHKAALTELAAVDLRGSDLTFSPIMARMVADRTSAVGEGGGGTTGGAHIRITARRAQDG